MRNVNFRTWIMESPVRHLPFDQMTKFKQKSWEFHRKQSQIHDQNVNWQTPIDTAVAFSIEKKS